jgi:hypothetical protein
MTPGIQAVSHVLNTPQNDLTTSISGIKGLRISIPKSLPSQAPRSNIYLDEYLGWTQDIINKVVDFDVDRSEIDYEFIYEECEHYIREYIDATHSTLDKWRVIVAAVVDIFIKFYGDYRDADVPWSSHSNSEFTNEEFTRFEFMIIKHFDCAIPSLM